MIFQTIACEDSPLGNNVELPVKLTADQLWNEHKLSLCRSCDEFATYALDKGGARALLSDDIASYLDGIGYRYESWNDIRITTTGLSWNVLLVFYNDIPAKIMIQFVTGFAPVHTLEGRYDSSDT